MGSVFYVVAQGEVKVSISGKVIRTMGRNAYFGERALLFEEPRSASIEVSSQGADIWSVDKEIFSTIVEGKMKQNLMERIKLQDTSVTMKDLRHVKIIGAGAAGVVRLVEHKSTKTRYALKRVKKKLGKVLEEVERECKLLAENDHPFVMHLVKTFETPQSSYMLTELITGGELHAAIRTIPTVLSRAQAQFYAGSLVLVLEELAGRNIVYRDLKPENVMLDAQGYLKLVDFGIAKKLTEGKNQTFTVIGTPHYMAPEVLGGRGYGVEVDIWSLGVLLYEFVCGYLPFADDLDNPTEVCQAVLKATLQFPSRYRDVPGKTLMTGMLRRQPRKRQGAGINGYDDLKSAEFFMAGHTGTSLFEKILGRKLDPPVVPKGEKYADPEDVADITLSDAGELG
jgi:cGMP-dependent protein kinase